MLKDIIIENVLTQIRADLTFQDTQDRIRALIRQLPDSELIDYLPEGYKPGEDGFEIPDWYTHFRRSL